MSINSASFQIVKVANILAVPADFPEHVCYYTQDTDKYYIYRNSLQEEVFITGGTNNFITAALDIVHADLVVAKSVGTLITGQKYRITDFQTVYDQPDFNNDGTPKTNPTVKTGPTEPIIVTAISDNELGVDAFQEDHPNDVIQYILEFTTPVTNTPTKGRIIKRIDDKNNESDFDHKNVLFKRYKNVEWDEYFEFFDNGESFQEFLAIPQGSNNYLGTQYTNFSNSGGSIPADGINVNDYPFDLPNIVLGIFSNEDMMNNRFSGPVVNVTFKQESFNNVFNGSVLNLIGGMFRSNTLERVRDVTIHSTFQNNKMGILNNVSFRGGQIYSNTISSISNVHLTLNNSGIRESVISGYFSNVNSTHGFELSNSIFTSISNITADDEFRFLNCRISVMNQIQIKSSTFFWNCTFDEILDTTFNGDFVWNQGKRIYSCEFKGSAAANTFGGGVEFSSFGVGFGGTDALTEYSDPILGQGYINTGAYGNIFLSQVSNAVFGAYCSGNTFNCLLNQCVFSDYMINNKFEDAQHGLGLYNTRHLYQKYKSTVFAHRQPHAKTYALGDNYMENSFSYPNLLFYRSELIDGVVTNLFAEPGSNLAVWQVSPSQINTVDGLIQNNSAVYINTRLLRQYTEYVYSGQSSLGWELNQRDWIPGVIPCYPTLAELQEIYNNRVAMGLSVAGKVWSSTEVNASTAYAIDFSTGATSSEPKSSELDTIFMWVKTYDYALKIKYINDEGSQVIESIY
jgi:hypothetical protein